MYNFKSTQEFFDEAVKRLRQMVIDGPCVDADGHCMYRGNGATKACIAGSFILDEHYRPEIESLRVGALLDDHTTGRVIDLVRLSGVSTEICPTELMEQLQNVHDRLNTTEEHLDIISRNFGLQLSPLTIPATGVE